MLKCSEHVLRVECRIKTLVCLKNSRFGSTLERCAVGEFSSYLQMYCMLLKYERNLYFWNGCRYGERNHGFTVATFSSDADDDKEDVTKKVTSAVERVTSDYHSGSSSDEDTTCRELQYNPPLYNHSPYQVQCPKCVCIAFIAIGTVLVKVLGLVCCCFFWKKVAYKQLLF